MGQIHPGQAPRAGKRFTSEQAGFLFRAYMQGDLMRTDVQEMMGVASAVFFPNCSRSIDGIRKVSRHPMAALSRPGSLRRPNPSSSATFCGRRNSLRIRACRSRATTTSSSGIA
jgi:hypothetical protein